MNSRNVFLVVFALLVFASLVSAWDIVDQQQTSFGAWCAISSNLKYYAQNFTPQQSTLSKVAIYSNRQGSPDAPLYMELRADNGGQPSSTVLATSSPTYTMNGWTSFDVSYPSMNTSAPYWIVLRSPLNNGVSWTTDYILGRSSTDQYANGSMMYSTNGGSSWTDSPTVDMEFKTYYATNYTDSFTASSGQNIIVTTVWNGTGSASVVLTRPAGTNLTESSMSTYERIQTSTTSNVKSSKVHIKRVNFTADASGTWNYTVASNELTAFTATVEIN